MLCLVLNIQLLSAPVVLDQAAVLVAVLLVLMLVAVVLVVMVVAVLMVL
jgi:hypothetical protein